MAKSITITIDSDVHAAKLLQYFCARYGYQDLVANPAFDEMLPEDPETNPSTIPNPETKVAFVKRLTIEWWRGEATHGKRKVDDQAIIDEFNDTNIVIS